jgi:hypothetical protein
MIGWDLRGQRESTIAFACSALKVHRLSAGPPTGRRVAGGLEFLRTMADDRLPQGEMLLYQTADGQTRVECRFSEDTIWMSQALLAELFETSPQNVTQHLKSIYDSGELRLEGTCKDFLQVRQEGPRNVRRRVSHYNLDAILAVGYRVRSPRGTQFRIWATQRLSEYLVKGFTMDDERLKNPPVEGSGVPDYFDELLERIRDIRASERRMYLRVREIFALAADYDPKRAEVKSFFQTIQNKLHYAMTGHTAAELIAERADEIQPNMGLTSWKGNVVRKADVTIAKNYLQQDEITGLNRIVTMWLDFAEDQALRRKQVFLQDWETKLDGFLEFNDRAVLTGNGSISKADADTQALLAYESFATRRRELLEAEGERAQNRALEDAAKELPPEEHA